MHTNVYVHDKSKIHHVWMFERLATTPTICGACLVPRSMQHTQSVTLTQPLSRCSSYITRLMALSCSNRSHQTHWATFETSFNAPWSFSMGTNIPAHLSETLRCNQTQFLSQPPSNKPPLQLPPPKYVNSAIPPAKTAHCRTKCTIFNVVSNQRLTNRQHLRRSCLGISAPSLNAVNYTQRLCQA